MNTVFMHAVVSVDGFIADAEDNVGPLFEWYFNGDAEAVQGVHGSRAGGSRGFTPWQTQGS
jgi:hypothetical protein